MPKKTKRKVSAIATQAPVADVMEVAERPTTTAVSGAAPRAFTRRASTTVEFNPDYTYVVKDLKRIGALAGSFFVVLIALSFILPMFIK